MSRLQDYLLQVPKEKQTPEAIAYLASLEVIANKSSIISEAIEQELKGQRSFLKLIASENYSSLAVQLAMGNLLTDKYAEGYAFHRFYAGCENVDICENEANEEAKKLFGCDHVYVQPHSGADANLVAFWSILVHKIQNKEIQRLHKKSLDELTEEEYHHIRKLFSEQVLMGMSLDSGGHLTHGYRHNISSKMMRSVSYGIDPKTELLDYQAIEKMAKKVKPTILLAGYSSYSRKINFATLREIADTVGAVFMVDMSHFSGLVAGKVFTGDYNPIPFAHIVTSTTHKTLRGPRGGMVMSSSEYADILDKGCPLVLGGPLPHVMAAKAVAFKEANSPEFSTYAHQVVENSQAFAEAFLKRGARIISNGTDNHLFVLDVSKFGITGRQAEDALRASGITVNRNAILNDVNGPWYTSGIRLGTPATTSLGMKSSEMESIAKIMLNVLKHTKPQYSEKTQKLSKAKYDLDPKIQEESRKAVNDLLSAFPLYPELNF